MPQAPSSSRLTYKCLSEEDLETFSDLVQDSHVREFLMEGMELSLDECKDFIAKSKSLQEKCSLGIYLIRLSDKVIGYCGFMDTHPVSADLDVVYAFPMKYTGQGFATEVCKALLALTAKVQFPADITAVVNPENKHSIKVLEKCQFKNEGFCEGKLNHLLKYRYSAS
ncbi:MAG TPA: GNAT family N-acetyltransferase [Bdellovibrio sp.]